MVLCGVDVFFAIGLSHEPYQLRRNVAFRTSRFNHPQIYIRSKVI